MVADSGSKDTEDNPLYEMTLSTAEMNLYLAEFKLLGANLPHTAAEYFKLGVEASAKPTPSGRAFNSSSVYQRLLAQPNSSLLRYSLVCTEPMIG